MSFDLVLFGGTGDLAWRKLMPALFQAFRHGSLPQGGRIIGIARDHLSDAQYRELIRARFDDVDLDKRPTPEEFDRFAGLLHFLRLDLSQPADYGRLATLLRERDAETVVMYLATAPTLFTTVCQQLAAAGLNRPNTRMVLEKPLGHDLASNRAINDAVREVLPENQIFRIDHYLGKPAVQNLFAMRFANALFEPVWRREYISNIQITIAEELGVEKRGAFYDGTGALRDMVQNHALQLLCALAMEPPINAHADAIRDEKLKVLRSLTPWTPQTLEQDVIRGQY
ncbi:MAG: glucose-6-phosphate dehydrogenase (NADP(+)), partial [Comamonadaceae bacterium]